MYFNKGFHLWERQRGERERMKKRRRERKRGGPGRNRVEEVMDECLTWSRAWWQKVMSGSRVSDWKRSGAFSWFLRTLAFSRYTCDTYGTFQIPLGGNDGVLSKQYALWIAYVSAATFITLIMGKFSEEHNEMNIWNNEIIHIRKWMTTAVLL